MSTISNGNLAAYNTEPDQDGLGHLIEDSVGATSGRMSKFDLDDVSRANTMIEASGVLEHIATWREQDRAGRHPGGARPVVSDRIILVVLLLIAREHTPLWATEMGAVLHRRLTPEARKFLGLPVTLSGTANGAVEAGRWYKAAWNAFHRIVDTMDPYPGSQHYKLIDRDARESFVTLRDPHLLIARRKRLNFFSDSLLEMTFRLLPREVRRRLKRHTTIGIDQTPIAAASPRGRSKLDKQGREIDENRLVIESDAGWYAKTVTKRDDANPDGTTSTDYTWGWAANIAVLVPNRHLDNAEFANMAIGFSMSIPNTDLASDTVDVLQSIIDRDYAPGTIVADRAYFANLTPDSFHVFVRNMGWGVITDYKKDGLGIKGGKAGALQVEGRHYCAATPDKLLNASVMASEHLIDEETYRERLEERTAYELRPKERPDSRGHQPMMCPAVGPNATVECPLRQLHPKASKKKDRAAVLTKNLPKAPDLICTQGSVDFGPEDGLRHAQEFRFQSKEWSDAYKIGRNTDESYHAYVKSSGHEALDIPARRRIRGFAAQQVMATMLLVSANIRKVLTFILNETIRLARAAATPARTTTKKVQRRRDREGHSNYKAKWPLAILPGAPDGAELDPPLRT